ncbi:hypothetical protein NP233_g1334 [Leucocoprinus birnbaumii]|uniref:Protein YIP n=1 Tax=Leucocoprinus birnbaumii TaxID=56174 RepID=A0AAD5YUY3_9AGAR|nr:hypothetical protein NP233_g1334 [Leucocoprinus birnbaumii]
MWQDNANPYSASSSQNAYYQAPAQEPLQFYAPTGGSMQDSTGFYPGSRPSLEGQGPAQGNIAQGGGYGGAIQNQGAWWTAFGTGGFEGEPPLLEGTPSAHINVTYSNLKEYVNDSELGINFSHIRAKSMTVLNPLQRVDECIMDDADLAGPIIFFFCFGLFLLFSGKPNFGYIYGVGLFGAASMYTLLNLMSDHGIDAYRVASVLGYCLLPMVGVSAISVAVHLE